MIIGIGNVGSTSLKTKILDIGSDDSIKLLGEANLDRIKSEGDSTFSCRVADGSLSKKTIQIVGFDAGIRYLLDWHVSNGVIKSPTQIEAMGFKTVMGVTNGANNLTPAILDEMRKFSFAAPVHNTPYIETISLFREILDVPMVGVFEPSFHYSLPQFRRYLGLPWKWHELGVRRFGFHGSSHRYLSAAAIKHFGTENIRIITVHLGGSSSLCAIKDGKSIDISQAFSPNSGILQGTRTGDTDGTAILYSMKELGLSIDEAQDAISKEGGLKGMAGVGSDDLRVIMDAAANGTTRAPMTIDRYVDQIRKVIASHATVMGGVDVIVFSGGIGENSSSLRELILDNMEFMGIKLDLVKNSSCKGTTTFIEQDGSAVKIAVIPTNEEMVVAYFTKKVVEQSRDLTPEEMVFRLK